MTKLKDRTGHKFGKLTVVSRAPNSKRGQTMWNCICECGNTTVSFAGHLGNGSSKSCGCVRVEKAKIGHPTHGAYQTRMCRAWTEMHRRCRDTTRPEAARYVNRGITVCERWAKFENFRDDMGATYEDHLTIDRIDNNSNYEPENCRWATYKQQANNRSNSRIITHDGKTLTIQEWSELTGINKGTLRDRLNAGWSVTRALTETVREFSK